MALAPGPWRSATAYIPTRGRREIACWQCRGGCARTGELRRKGPQCSRVTSTSERPATYGEPREPHTPRGGGRHGERGSQLANRAQASRTAAASRKLVLTHAARPSSAVRRYCNTQYNTWSGMCAAVTWSGAGAVVGVAGESARASWGLTPPAGEACLVPAGAGVDIPTSMVGTMRSSQREGVCVLC